MVRSTAQHTPVQSPGSRLRAVLGEGPPPGLPKRAAAGPVERAAAASEILSGLARRCPEVAAQPQAQQPAPRPAAAPSNAGGAQRAVGSPAPDEDPEVDLSTNPSGVAWRGLIALGRTHAGTLGVVLVIAVVLAGTRLMSAQGHEVPGGTPSAVLTPAASAPSTPAVPTRPPVRVHVLGAVVSPGVVTVPEGSRVSDAILAAGGLTAEAQCAELNLAAVVPDGAQIVIGTLSVPRGELRTGSSPGQSVGGLGAVPGSLTLDLNTATVEQLESLPGVGPVTAQRILTWRQTNGGFTRVEELQEVDGIGPKTYAQLAPLVHV